MSQVRLRRAESLLREEIGKLFLNSRIKDARIKGRVTVMDVSVSKDLRYAKVYVSLMADSQARPPVVDALNHAAGFIQKLLSEQVVLRYIPKLTFYLDESIEKGMDLIKKIQGLVP